MDLCEACRAPLLTQANVSALMKQEGLALKFMPRGGCQCYAAGPNPSCKVCWPDYAHCQPCGEHSLKGSGDE